MASRQTLSAKPGTYPAGDDWQASGLVDQMLAYRDWWNLPVRRHGADKASKADRA